MSSESIKTMKRVRAEEIQEEPKRQRQEFTINQMHFEAIVNNLISRGRLCEDNKKYDGLRVVMKQKNSGFTNYKHHICPHPRWAVHVELQIFRKEPRKLMSSRKRMHFFAHGLRGRLFQPWLKNYIDAKKFDWSDAVDVLIVSTEQIRNANNYFCDEVLDIWV